MTGPTTLINTLETINLRSKDRRVAYVVTQTGRIEAPNWFPDDTNTLYFNTGGRLYKVQAEPPGTKPNPGRLRVPEAVDLGTLTRINNDHGISRDGSSGRSAISRRRSMAGVHRWCMSSPPEAAPTAGDRTGAVVLPRLVARCDDAGLLRRAQRQLRRLQRSRCWRRGEAAHDRRGQGRRAGVFA